MDIVERLRSDAASSQEGYQCICYVRTVNEAVETILALRARIEGLRGVIEHLENANDALAAKRSPATYLALEAEARDELTMLDEARRNARSSLAQEPNP